MRTLCYILLIYFVLGITSSICASSAPQELYLSESDTLNYPTTINLPEEFVPYDQVEKLAITWANHLWGQVVKGPVIPYTDFYGKTVAYMFNFVQNESKFPSCEFIFQDIKDIYNIPYFPTMPLSPSLPKKYYHLLISSRYDRVPILKYGEGLSSFYTYGPKALKYAQIHLNNTKATLSRFLYIFPDEEYLELNTTDTSIIFDIYSKRIYPSINALLKHYNLASEYEGNVKFNKQMKMKWDLYLSGIFPDRDSLMVSNYEKWAPFYDWSYGCVPTSAAMVLGYWDRDIHYGKLINHYFKRWDDVQGETDFQTPSTTRSLAIEMHTDSMTGGTLNLNVVPGLNTYLNNLGYSFICNWIIGSYPDWQWSTIVNEINSNYPIVWCNDWEHHASAVFGYNSAEEVGRHNTWNPYLEWVAHGGGALQLVDIFTIHPGGGNNHNISLKVPHGELGYNEDGGGEYVNAGLPFYITWDNFGNASGTVYIYLSTDGGINWNIIAGCANTGQYNWNVPSNLRSDSCRVAIQLEDPGLIASDGSFGNFIIKRIPPCQMFQVNQYHWGRTGYVGPSSPTLYWAYPTTSGVESSPIIGKDGTIYVGSNDYNLYAIYPNGTLKWSYNTSCNWFSSPAIDTSNITYIGGASRLYAINPDGTRKWRKYLGSTVLPSPVIGKDGTIYTGNTTNSVLYAINPDSSIKWSCTLSGGIYCSPALTPGDSVIIGALDGKVYCVYNGQIMWSYQTGGMIYGAPQIEIWNIRHGSWWLTDYDIFITSQDHKLYKISQYGQEDWTYSTNGNINSAAALGWGEWNQRVYVTSEDSCLHCIDSRHNRLLWKYRTNGMIDCSPVIDGEGTIYFSSRDGYLYAINPNGTQKWRFQIGNAGYLNFSSPAIGPNKTIYIGYSSHINLLAIRDNTVDVEESQYIQQDLMNLNIFPSPVKNYVFFNIKPQQKNLRIRIYDIQGRLIKSIYTKLINKGSKIIWDLRDSQNKSVPSGIYFCVLNNGEQNISKKFIIIE